MTWRVLIYPLAADQPAMFAQTFTKPYEALEYVAFWLVLGSCRIEECAP